MASLRSFVGRSRRVHWLVPVWACCVAVCAWHLLFNFKRAQSWIGNIQDTNEATENMILADMRLAETRETANEEIMEVLKNTDFQEKTEEGVVREEEEEEEEEEKQEEQKEEDKESGCIQHNSAAWLEGPRFGNIREGMPPELAQKMILNLSSMLQTTTETSVTNTSQAQDLLGRSMCLKNSRFVQSDSTAAAVYDENDKRLVRLWATRLSYLGMHYHQHRLAIPEAQARFGLTKKGDSCRQEELTARYDVGNFDYECANAKYIIFGLSGIGIGANIRSGAAIGLMAGLTSDRIVLFISEGPEGTTGFEGRWPLASCDRGDHQCFFMPTTPCVPTHQDLKNAWIMPKHESRMFLTKNGKLPAEHVNDKVIKSFSLYQPQAKVPKLAKQKLFEYAKLLIDGLPLNDPRIKLLRKASDAILKEDRQRDGYTFAAATQKVAHALGFYAMRPNPTSAQDLADIFQEIIPPDLSPERTVGLPIRASDKCGRESQCLSFDQHMQATSDLWARHLNESSANSKEKSAGPTVLFTTESKDILHDQQDFVSNSTRQAQFLFPFRFVTNTKDVIPNTGKLRPRAARKAGTTADGAMLSAMSSLQAQMVARLSIGNCCSNFHALLSDYLMEGCGSASDNTFQCLQEHENPVLRICCVWQHDCKEAKQKAIDELEAAALENASINAGQIGR
jgi:hypothetical protein